MPLWLTLWSDISIVWLFIGHIQELLCYKYFPSDDVKPQKSEGNKAAKENRFVFARISPAWNTRFGPIGTLKTRLPPSGLRRCPVKLVVEKLKIRSRKRVPEIQTNRKENSQDLSHKLRVNVFAVFRYDPMQDAGPGGRSTKRARSRELRSAGQQRL